MNIWLAAASTVVSTVGVIGILACEPRTPTRWAATFASLSIAGLAGIFLAGL